MAPWALAAGALVSFTASAGYETSIGSSEIARLGSRDVPPLPLGARLIGPNAERRPGPGAMLARLPLDFSVPPPDRDAASDLRADLKASARVFPAVERARKGDPIVALRSTLSRLESLRAEAGVNRLILRPGPLVTTFAAGPATWDAEREAVSGFVPFPSDDPTATDHATSQGSPRSAASVATRAADARAVAGGGTTPSVPRAVALSSTTPAPADAVPVEIAAAPVSIRLDRDPRAQTTTASRSEPQPTEADRNRFADLVGAEDGERQQRCLAEAVYFEARGESEEGQAAVAQVVLNRAKSGLYPANICGVVYQNRHRYMGCQFSFACEGRSLRITDATSWATATRIAQSVVEGRTYLAEVGGATHYHADYVRPSWSRRLTRMDVIGRHVFYKLKPGQT